MLNIFPIKITLMYIHSPQKSSLQLDYNVCPKLALHAHLKEHNGDLGDTGGHLGGESLNLLSCDHDLACGGQVRVIVIKLWPPRGLIPIRVRNFG